MPVAVVSEKNAWPVPEGRKTIRKVVPRMPAAPTGVLTVKDEPWPYFSFFTSPTNSPRFRRRLVTEAEGSSCNSETFTVAPNGSWRNSSRINSVSAPSRVVAPLEKTSTTEASL